MSPDDRDISQLFRQLLTRLNFGNEALAAPLDAALTDLPKSMDEIHDRITPALRRVGGNGALNIDDVLDLFIQLKLEIEHIQFHANEALPPLDECIRIALERTTSSKRRPSEVS